MKENNKIFEIEVTKKLKIEQEDIDDIMVGALEGGINYWVNKVDVVGEYLGEYASDQISNGGTLCLHDYVEESWHELTLDKFLNGIQKWYEDGYDRYNAVQNDGTLDCCNIDAGAADSIVQYAIFGEIIYG